MRRAPFATALLLTLGRGAELHAQPEWNAAAQGSLCGTGDGQRAWKKTGFCGSFRADLLFGRERNADLAVGPYASIGTARFSDARFGAGLSLLLPTFGGDFPVLFSAGAASRDARDVRLSGELFFGLRSHNFHGLYAMASGVIVGGDSALTGDRANTLYLGLQVDGLWLALPFILGYEWLHPAPYRGD